MRESMAAQGFKANFLGTIQICIWKYTSHILERKKKKTNKKDWILFGYVSGSIQEVSEK